MYLLFIFIFSPYFTFSVVFRASLCFISFFQQDREKEKEKKTNKKKNKTYTPFHQASKKKKKKFNLYYRFMLRSLFFFLGKTKTGTR